MAILPIMEVVFHPLLLRMPISLLGFLIALGMHLSFPTFFSYLNPM